MTATNASSYLAPGVWGVLATPFGADGTELDPVSLERQVRRFHDGGATGLTVLGVFGEAARLAGPERREAVKTVAAAADGLPLVVGVSALSTAPAIEEIENVLDVAGPACAGVMVQVNSPDASAFVRHLDAVHRATGVPTVVQDYPAATGITMPVGELVAAVRALPHVVAVKSESSPSSPAVAALVAGLDVPVFGGLGGTCLLDELAVGAAGAMTGFSVPEGLVACVRAYRAGGLDAAREAWLPYLPLVNFEFQPGLALALRKESLRRQGVFDRATVRAPAAGFPAALSDLLDRHLAATPNAAVRTPG